MGSLVSHQSPAVDAPVRVTSDYQAAQLIAIVGTERVLAGDLAAIVEPILLENKAKITSRLQEDAARDSLPRQVLPQYVEMKVMQQEFFRDMAGNVPPAELRKIRRRSPPEPRGCFTTVTFPWSCSSGTTPPI